MVARKLLKGLLVGCTGFLLLSCSDDEPPKVAEHKAATVGQPSAQAAGMAQAVAHNMAGKSGFSKSQEKAIAELVRKTLLERPEILQEAFAALEKRDKEREAKSKQEALASSADMLFRSKLSPVAGDPRGDVTVVEFFDYNCPYCRKAFHDLDAVMKDDPKLRVVFKEYPIFGGASLIAAKAALAARKQGKYFEFHSAILRAEGRATRESVFRTAKKLGLDIARLKKDMNSPEVRQSIAETRRLASRLGIHGTPAFYVGDKYIGGAPRNLVDLMKNYAKDIRQNGCKHC